MSHEMPDALRELARVQGGVVSVGQAFGAGMTKAALARRLRSGRWQPLQRGVHAVFSGQPGREAVPWAAVLRAGRDAVLSHHTAAELTCLTDSPSTRVHLTPGLNRAPPRYVSRPWRTADLAG